MRPSKTCTKPEISQFNMSICINQDIIRFDITMNESQIMNTFYCTCYFGYVKPESKGGTIFSYQFTLAVLGCKSGGQFDPPPPLDEQGLY